jgi:D-alanyl-D-alanine dipeptidase
MGLLLRFGGICLLAILIAIYATPPKRVKTLNPKLASPLAPAKKIINKSLVDVGDLVPTARIAMKYATTDNFTGTQLYKNARCLVVQPTAIALAAAQKRAEQQGLSLVFYDCYRPHSVQQQMWAKVPDSRYVANPNPGSNHNRGTAVDVGLYKEGQELDMGSPFDSFAEQSHRNARITTEQQKNRDLLKEIMGPQFTTVQTEWWHFDFVGAKNYPVLNDPL